MAKYTNKELLDPKYGKQRRKEFRDEARYGLTERTEQLEKDKSLPEGFPKETYEMKAKHRARRELRKKSHVVNIFYQVARSVNQVLSRTYKAQPVSEEDRTLKFVDFNDDGKITTDEYVKANYPNKKKKTITAVVTILALFTMYLMSLQASGVSGYATCVSDGNMLLGGIALIVIILLFVLISTRKMKQETIHYVTVKPKRKVSSKRRK